MRFENPYVLYFLALPLLAAGLLFLGIWSRKRILSRFGNRQTVEAQLGVQLDLLLRVADGGLVADVDAFLRGDRCFLGHGLSLLEWSAAALHAHVRSAGRGHRGIWALIHQHTFQP